MSRAVKLPGRWPYGVKDKDWLLVASTGVGELPLTGAGYRAGSFVLNEQRRVLEEVTTVLSGTQSGMYFGGNTEQLRRGAHRVLQLLFRNEWLNPEIYFLAVGVTLAAPCAEIRESLTAAVKHVHCPSWVLEHCWNKHLWLRANILQHPNCPKQIVAETVNRVSIEKGLCSEVVQVVRTEKLSLRTQFHVVASRFVEMREALAQNPFLSSEVRCQLGKDVHERVVVTVAARGDCSLEEQLWFATHPSPVVRDIIGRNDKVTKRIRVIASTI